MKKLTVAQYYVKILSVNIGKFVVSPEITNTTAELGTELKVEEVVTLIERSDLERLQRLVKICGIDLIYLAENENPENLDVDPYIYKNLVVSELPQTSEEDLIKAARLYSKNLNDGIYKAKDSESAIRTKLQKPSTTAPVFVSIKTGNDDVAFDDFNLLFYVLREKGSDNINNKLQMEKSISSKLLANRAEKNRREKARKNINKLSIKAPIDGLIEIDSVIAQDEDDTEEVVMPTFEELEGKI